MDKLNLDYDEIAKFQNKVKECIKVIDPEREIKLGYVVEKFTHKDTMQSLEGIAKGFLYEKALYSFSWIENSCEIK